MTHTDRAILECIKEVFNEKTTNWRRLWIIGSYMIETNRENEAIWDEFKKLIYQKNMQNLKVDPTLISTQRVETFFEHLFIAKQKEVLKQCGVWQNPDTDRIFLEASQKYGPLSDNFLWDSNIDKVLASRRQNLHLTVEKFKLEVEALAQKLLLEENIGIERSINMVNKL